MYINLVFTVYKKVVVDYILLINAMIQDGEMYFLK